MDDPRNGIFYEPFFCYNAKHVIKDMYYILAYDDDVVVGI